MESRDFTTFATAAEFLASHGYERVPSASLPNGYAAAADLWTYRATTQQAASVWLHGESYRAATWPASGAPSRAVARALEKAGSAQGARA